MECLERSLRTQIDGVEAISIEDVTDQEHVSQGAKDGRAIADGGLQLRLLIVATSFDGVRRIDRHRLVNESFGDLVLNGRIHSLEIRAWTPDESQKRASRNDGPIGMASAKSGKQDTIKRNSSMCDCGQRPM